MASPASGVQQELTACYQLQTCKAIARYHSGIIRDCLAILSQWQYSGPLFSDHEWDHENVVLLGIPSVGRDVL